MQFLLCNFIIVHPGGKQKCAISHNNAIICMFSPVNNYEFSSPLSIFAPYREASFVYHDKRGFSCVLGKNRADIVEIGLSDGRSAVRKPDFFISGRENGQKCWCTFCASLLCKERQKGTGWVDLNLKDRVVKPFSKKQAKVQTVGKVELQQVRIPLVAL